MPVKTFMVFMMTVCSTCGAQTVAFESFFHDKTLRVDYFQCGSAQTAMDRSVQRPSETSSSS